MISVKARTREGEQAEPMIRGNASALSRRDFFRRRPSAPLDAPPPAAAVEFARLCDGCGDCLPVCDEKILHIVEGKAQVDFARGECTFCNDCVEACDRGALSQTALKAWGGRPAVAQNCIGVSGVICRACGDACGEGAIRFAVSVAGSPPNIDLSACNGCGACVAPCPVGAISVRIPEVCA